MEKILSYVEKGIKEGAKLVVGGNRHGDKGYFVQPTVFSNVEDHHTIAKEEVSLHYFPVVLRVFGTFFPEILAPISILDIYH